MSFDLQGELSSCTLRVNGTGFFLTYRGSTGAMKLVSGAAGAIGQPQKQGTVGPAAGPGINGQGKSNATTIAHVGWVLAGMTWRSLVRMHN